MCFSDLTPWPPSLRGKGENLAGFSPLRLREGPGERLTPQRVGPKTPAKPTRVGKANGGVGNWGWRGPKALANGGPRGLGDVPPRTLKGGDLPSRHEWGPKRRQTLSPRGWETGGPGGASPLAGGCGGCAPKIFKERVGPKRARGWANSCPQNFQRGASHPATSGAQNAGELSAYEGGQIGGPGGEAPMAGAWGVPPTKPKGGEQPPLATSPTSGAQNAGEP
jgi:hypothetical protein